MAYDKKALHRGGNVAADDEEFLKATSDPWKASASGHGYNAKFNDDGGHRRGLGAYSDDDKDSFLRPSQDRTDHEQPLDIFGEVMSHSGPGGPMLTGGAPIRPIGGDINPKRRYKLGRGGQSNGGL